MSRHDNSTAETSNDVANSRSLSRRRALGLGAAVAGGVWAAPVIMSFDAASATSSGGGTTTTTYVAPPPSSSTTSSSTTTTTVAQRTITATVTGNGYGLVNPSPVTVNVGEQIVLTFTRAYSEPYARSLHYSTVNGTAVAGVDFTASSGNVIMPYGVSTPQSITIQTTATGPGANTNFTVNVFNDV